MAVGLFLVSYIKKARTNQRKEAERRKRYKEKSEREREEQRKKREEQDRLRKEKYERYFDDKEFVNKHTARVEDFIINDLINGYDLEKLARLNGIRIEMHGGWYSITLELIKELGKIGWKGRVHSIKEKFGELRFYAQMPPELKGNKAVSEQYTEIMDKYKNISLCTCEVCGKEGRPTIRGVWEQTLCDEHKGSAEYIWDDEEE